MTSSGNFEGASKIPLQHRSLDSFFDETKRLLTGSEGLAACAELREALEVHFDQEKSLYFPVIRRLSPEHEAQLASFLAAHKVFLEQLDSTVEFLKAGNTERAVDRFSALQRGFSKHELGEESMLGEISGD